MAENDLSWLKSDNLDAENDPELGHTSHHSAVDHNHRVNKHTTPPASPTIDSNKPSWLEETTPLNPNKTKLQPASERKTMKYKPGGSTRKSVMPLPASASTMKQKVVTTTVSQEEDGCCCPVDPVLYWFRVFHFIAGLIAILTLVSNTSLFFIANLTWRAYVLHGYATTLCLLIISVELEIQVIIAKLKILDLWVFRGLFYSFVGFLSRKCVFKSVYLSCT